MKRIELKKILANSFPLKRLGQHFLLNEKILDKIVNVAEISSKDFILEIGPGFGNLTKKLAKRANFVLAVEKDKRMIEIAKIFLKDFKNVKIIQGDILKINFSQLKIRGKYKVVANLPYYISAPTIRKFLEKKRQPEIMVLLVQKEVAQRIVAKPPKMNLLAASIQVYSQPKIVQLVSKKCFWPSPKVDGAIIKILPSVCPLNPAKLKIFFKILNAGFFQPRKQLINNFAFVLGGDKIKIGRWLLNNGIQPSQRAENLSMKDWYNLTNNFIF